ncbi:MAG: PfkB family carbohydrate kinase [Acidimicrobiales bacterium]|nr:PfkB family carbohydrate kinase [Acidimicrobiales bacterium]
MSGVVFVSGNFNVLHPGHLRLFRFAREMGDRLVVGVQSDRIGGSAAHIPEALRLDGVASNSFVDECFLFDEPVADLIARLRPDVVVKGREHEGGVNAEAVVIEEYGGQLVFSSGEAVFSSLDLIRVDALEDRPRLTGASERYLARHDIGREEINSACDRFSELNVCVIGDLIIDEYVTCDALGMSQEDPTVVVTPVDTQRFLGGAGVVAAHAAGLGATTHFLSVMGDDEVGTFALTELKKCGVLADLLVDETRPTTLKQRFRSGGMTLLRVSHLHQDSVDGELQNQLLERFEEIIDSCDLLVFSDFNYGCLPQQLVDNFLVRARSKGLCISADSQSSSQVGDVARFRGVDLLTPTEHEARVSLRGQDDGLVVLAERLRALTNASNIVLKLGAEGALLHFSGTEGEYQTDRIPPLNLTPQDVAGAGDSLLITASMALAAGSSAWVAAYLGSVAAAVQVGRVGNVPLRLADLAAELEV